MYGVSSHYPPIIFLTVVQKPYFFLIELLMKQFYNGLKNANLHPV